MDIAGLLEAHRKHMLEVAQASIPEEDDDANSIVIAVEIAHDRATTRTLLDLYRQGNTGNGQSPVGQASTATNTVTVTSRRVKAGSKKARERALKAGETRRKNLAAKAGSGDLAPVAINQNDPPAGEGGGE